MDSDNRPPDRWLECPPFGDVIPDINGSHRFIPLKTPLGDHIDLPPGYIFTPEIFIDQMKEKKLDVGLLINLTFTTKYYDYNQVMDDLDIEFKQIACRGHNEAPQPHEQNEFIKTCKAFFMRNPKKIIAVHCTHGFNRTGFMICSYLYKECDWEICAAIERFAERRYPGIYKQDYINELLSSFGDEDDPIPEAAPRPVWDAEDAIDIELGNLAAASSSRKEPEFYEGINDVTLVKDRALVHKIYRHCCMLCDYKNNGSKILFPGGQPVSLDMANIKLLSQNRYRVSWKADGCRYMLYIQDEENMFFLTRNLDMWRITGLSFPKLEDLSQSLRDTLLDGEMVTDIDGDQKIPRFLIYDVISLDGNIVAQENFDKRCGLIRNVIIRARERAKHERLINSEGEPFKVRDKGFYDVHYAQKTWKMTVSHEKDGLIFQPWALPYSGGTCPQILKWKPPNLNSIDFRIRIRQERREGCLPEDMIELLVSNQTKAPITLKMDRNKTHFKKYDGKIVEMAIPDQKNWIILRERTDKTSPNSYETMRAVISSIKNPVTEEILFKYIAEKIPLEPRPPAR